MEIRFDKILEHKSIINPVRSKRPQYFEKPKETQNLSCVLCPGMEMLTPEEFLRKGDGNIWKMRLVLNKFPFIEGDLGKHFVIIESREHIKEFWDFTDDDLLDALIFWRDVYNFLNFEYKPEYIFLFKNRGKDSGASIMHVHSQILSLNFRPEKLIAEVNNSYENNACLYCDLIKKELKGERLIKETKNYATLTVYAPRLNYETIIISKAHTSYFESLDNDQLIELRDHLRNILNGLRDLNCSYNIYFHNAPKHESGLHFYLRILPRLNIIGSYELGTGEYIITVSPEDAADFYRKN